MEKIGCNTVVVDKHKRPINGHFNLLFVDDDMGSTEKLLLRSYLNVTKNIAGCQALRARIGHILFGFRCVHGEVIFVTVSPNRRQSALIMKLSRARKEDTMLCHRNQHSSDVDKALAYWRHRYCGPDAPGIFSTHGLAADPNGDVVTKEIEKEWS